MSDTFDCVKLGDVAEITMGQSPDSQYVEEGLENGTPFLQGNAEFGDHYPTPKYSCSQPGKTAREGDVLVSVRAPVGEVNLADRRYCIGRGLSAIRFTSVPSSLGQKLIAYFGVALSRVAQGTTFEAINRDELSSLLLQLPPPDEQPIIARILDTLDTQIRRTEALIAKLEQIKQGLLTDLLTRGIDENGELRPPPEEAPHLYKESPLGQIPRTWEVSFLAEKAKPGIPHIRTGPFGSALKGEHWVREGHPVITIGSLGEGDFDRSELLFVRPQDANRLAVFQLELGDVVFSRVADVGRSVAISDAEVGWIMSSNLMRISLDRSKIVPEFLQLQLGSEMAKRQVRANVNAGGRDVANSAIMNQLRFFWPEYREQERICQRMSAAKAVSTAHLRELSSLRHLKAGLMDDLLTGQVRVTPLLDESAQATG